MESAPTGSLVEVKLATPVESSVALPNAVVPLLKVTVPVGRVEPEEAVTAALSSTGWP